MRKTFLITQFGSPHEWTQKYIDHVQQLGKYGWEWKIFTPNNFKSKGNVEIVPMDIEQFVILAEKKLDVLPHLFITESGVPSLHITDMHVMFGKIFEDYIKNSKFWGMTNLDIVYGRLDHFISNEALSNCSVFTNDPMYVNGTFSLFRNTKEVNELFMKIPDWEKCLMKSCTRCTTGEGKHELMGTDEYGLTEVLQKYEPKKGVLRTKYFPLISHDRMEQHVPEVKLEIKDDGSLWEVFKDTAPPNWIYAHPYLGHEIMMFHFNHTKKWPQCINLI